MLFCCRRPVECIFITCMVFGACKTAPVVSTPSDRQQLIISLDSIYKEDQRYRVQADSLQRLNKWNDPALADCWKKMAAIDSSNVIAITQIIDKYGWPGKTRVGENGNATVFLVIQHADLATQQKYLPVLQAAVEKGDGSKDQLALLTDRVLILEGKKQRYGTQIGIDTLTKKFFLSPTEDLVNLDKRRKEMGLPPINEYLARWNIKWELTGN